MRFRDKTLLDLHEQYLRALPEEKTSILSIIETIFPDSEIQWNIAHTMFSLSAKTGWVEIMIDRFLAVEPNNLAAQLAMLELRSRQFVVLKKSSEKERISQAGFLLLQHPNIDVHGLMTVGNALLLIYSLEYAEVSFRRVLAVDRQHLFAWKGLLSALRSSKKNTRVVQEMKAMRVALPPTEINLLEIAKQALWTKDYTMLRELATVLFQMRPAPRAESLVQLVVIAYESAQSDIMREALGRIEVAALDQPWMLQKLIDISRFYGLSDLQSKARAKLNTIAPSR